MNLVQAASVSIHKSHGQYIENIHLQTYTSEEHFWDTLYKNEYSKLLDRARDFLDDTGGPGDDVLIFIRFVSRSFETSSATLNLIYTAAVWTPANMNTSPCRGTTERCLCHSTTDSREMRVL